MAKKSKKKVEAPPAAAPAEEAPALEESEGAVAETAAADAKGIEERLIELEEERGRVRDESADANDRALRILAEFDTYRRRSERERAAASDRGAADVLRELLDVVDNFDRALEHTNDELPESFLDGLRLVARSLHDVLDRRGVERIEATGQPFDPELHEALSSMPGEDVEPNTVLSEVQPGYKLGERVLRAAKVIVSRAES